MEMPEVNGEKVNPNRKRSFRNSEVIGIYNPTPLITKVINLKSCLPSFPHKDDVLILRAISPFL